MTLNIRKIAPLVLLGFSFCITMCISSVYAIPSPITIDTATVGGTAFTFGDVIGPSEENPLFFHFNSADFLTYTCRIVKVDQNLFDTLLSAATQFAASQINLVGIEISNENCGEGTDGSVTYAQSFSDGLFVFEVIGTDTNGTGTKTPFAFEVLGEQALVESPAGQPGQTTQNVTGPILIQALENLINAKKADDSGNKSNALFEVDEAQWYLRILQDIYRHQIENRP